MYKTILLHNIRNGFSKYFSFLIAILILVGVFQFTKMYTVALENDLSKNAIVNSNQILLTYDESMKSEMNINFYGILSSEYDDITPFLFTGINNITNRMNETINCDCNVLATDLSKKWVYLGINETFEKFEIQTISSETGVVVSKGLYTENASTINLNGIEYSVIGIIDIDEDIILLDYTLYMRDFETDHIGMIGDNEYVLFDGYLIVKDVVNDNDVKYIKQLYNDYYPQSEFVLTNKLIVTRDMENLFPYSQYILIVTIFIIIISFFNISNSLLFVINERKQQDSVFLLLGLTKRKLKNLYTLEFLISTAISILIALVISSILIFIYLSLNQYEIVFTGFIDTMYLIVGIEVAVIIFTNITLKMINFNKLNNNMFE